MIQFMEGLFHRLSMQGMVWKCIHETKHIVVPWKIQGEGCNISFLCQQQTGGMNVPICLVTESPRTTDSWFLVIPCSSAICIIQDIYLLHVVEEWPVGTLCSQTKIILPLNSLYIKKFSLKEIKQVDQEIPPLYSHSQNETVCHFSLVNFFQGKF